jgi:hypothetical protein
MSKTSSGRAFKRLKNLIYIKNLEFSGGEEKW